MVPSITRNDLGESPSIAKNTRHGGIGRLRIMLIVSLESEAPGRTRSLDRFQTLPDDVADVASEPTDSDRVPKTFVGAE
jgi:hypothetical protein